MTIALVLFALAALGGVTMAAIRLRGAERPPTALALVHGAGAAAGLIALIVAVMGVPALRDAAKTALVVFLVAALGGFYLFAQHMQKKPLPIPVMVVHGLVAVTGLHDPADGRDARAMRRGLRIGGHPLHAALSDFPMVLLLLWVALDGAALVLGSPLLWMLGRWALIGGTAAAVLAASAGFMDYLALGETASRARSERRRCTWR